MSRDSAQNAPPDAYSLMRRVQVVSPEAYQANLQTLAHLQRALDTAVQNNEAGRQRYAQMQGELLARVHAGEEARRVSILCSCVFLMVQIERSWSTFRICKGERNNVSVSLCMLTVRRSGRFILPNVPSTALVQLHQPPVPVSALEINEQSARIEELPGDANYVRSICHVISLQI
jgi:hypothetical protein